MNDVYSHPLVLSIKTAFFQTKPCKSIPIFTSRTPTKGMQFGKKPYLSVVLARSNRLLWCRGSGQQHLQQGYLGGTRDQC